MQDEAKKSDLKPGEGGRVMALESADVIVDEGFRKRGEPYMKASVRTGEHVYREYSAALQTDSQYAVTQHNIPLVKVPPQTPTYSALETPEAGGEGEKVEYNVLQHQKDYKAVVEGKEKYSLLQHLKSKVGGMEKKIEVYSVLENRKDTPGGEETKGAALQDQKDDTVVAQIMPGANRLDEYPCMLMPCTSMWNHNKYLLRKKGTPPPPEQVAAWFPEDRKWPMEKKDKLKVYFINKCPREWIPKCRGDVITWQFIMELLDGTWRNCFTASRCDPHIHVAFHGERARNCSALGSVANSIDQPTMVLNFSNMKESEILATIVHQFGHALGLGHALMKPEDWHVLRKYVDQREMMEFYGSPTMEDFEVQWTGKGLKEMVNYDEGSVMQYRTDLKWLKEATYRTIQGINESTLSKTDKMKLKIFHEHARSSKAKPSANDLETLNIETKPEEPEDLPKDLPQGFQDHRKLFHKEPLTREDFLTLKAGATLTHKLAPAWKAIGEKLRMRKEVLAKINGSSKEDAERLMAVWVKWLDQELPTEKYPPTWEGLYRLLDACGHKTIADEHFNF